jgi:UDP-glucuronate 4-epimerase
VTQKKEYLSTPVLTHRTILVTGGAGFIGSHLVEALLKLKVRVIVVDNFSPFYSPQQKEANIAPFVSHPNFTLIRGDILDEAVLRSLDKKNVDTIVHLAALAGVRNSLLEPEKYMEVNVTGTLRLLEFARKHHIKQFILASSSSVYGASATAPFTENQKLGIPTSPYAVSKIAAESLCQTYHFLYGIPVSILRFFSVYGPHGRPDMAPFIFARSLLEDTAISIFGSSTELERDYTYISDIVDGIIKTIHNPFPFEVMNLGSSHPIPLTELIAQLEKNAHKKARIITKPRQHSDLQLTYASIKKTRQLLKWEPQTPFSEGIAEFWKWMVSQTRV